MFFGSMLVLISTDLMWEWLVMAAAKMMGTEYAVCIATFVAIMIMGIETGTAQNSTAQHIVSHSMNTRHHLDGTRIELILIHCLNCPLLSLS
jgi:hypothetical protein